MRDVAEGSQGPDELERPATPGGGRSAAHGFVYVASKLRPGAFGFLTTMVLTRLLSPADYGLYGLGLAITTLLSRAIFDWQGQTFVRFAQRPESSERVARTSSILFLFLVAASAIGYLGFWLSGFAANYVALGAVALVGAWALSWFEFSALHRVVAFKPLSYGAMNILRAILVFVGASAAAWLTGDPLLVLGASFGGALLAAWLYPRGSDRKKPPAPAYLAAADWRILRAMLRFGLPIACGGGHSGEHHADALLASGLGMAGYSLARARA